MIIKIMQLNMLNKEKDKWILLNYKLDNRLNKWIMIKKNI